jgi:hypothetical protein
MRLFQRRMIGMCLSMERSLCLTIFQEGSQRIEMHQMLTISRRHKLHKVCPQLEKIYRNHI